MNCSVPIPRCFQETKEGHRVTKGRPKYGRPPTTAIHANQASLNAPLTWKERIQSESNERAGTGDHERAKG